MAYGRVVAAWFALALAMSANGLVRELYLKRLVGPAAGDVLSAATGAIIILAVTAVLFRPFAGRPLRDLGRASALLVVLTITFELVIGRYLDRKSWQELLENYAVWRGRLWPVLLVIVALTPFVWGRWSTGPATTDA